eukprot:TRINITY_DN1443_c0_g1_i12.p1 TRINITY_DN1443_c0_g1~~TRINITY_DN1443_c0_g1_i12.p1  ORF type:complete len:562 (+),score=146.57 TRINITY_DN1443_c0_g1_i12:204-1889(+)
MTQNYLDKYNEEPSESSIVTEEEEDKKVLRAKAPAALPPRPSENSRKPTPYTFDARSFLKSVETNTSCTDSRSGNTPVGYKPLPSFISNYSRGEAKSSMPMSLRRSGSYTRLHSDTSSYTNIGEDYRRSDDYSKFSKEFEVEFARDQKEIERIRDRLTERFDKVNELSRELEDPDRDMILFGCKFSREIGDSMNDLREAHGYISTLMEDRIKMKEQFCIFKMKIKKQQSFIKTFQEDIQARDIAYGKLRGEYEESREEANGAKAELAKLKKQYDEKMAENIQLRRDATSLKAECEKLKKVVSDGALESGRQESAVKKLGAQLSQRQEEMNRMAQNAKVMSEEIKDQASYIEKMQENYNRLCMENSQLKKIQDDYMKESAEAWEQNKQLKSQLNETRGMLEGVNSELQMTKEHLDSVLPENENLRHVVDELKAKLDQAIDDNKKLVEEQDVIISQDSLKLQSSMDACKGLTEEVGRLRTDNEKLKVRAAVKSRPRMWRYWTGCRSRTRRSARGRKTKCKDSHRTFANKKPIRACCIPARVRLRNCRCLKRRTYQGSAPTSVH